MESQEEERFANALIEEFEKGTIQDCENGCTLRAYLSRKLHCAPMRISKKYAGKSIGKHVFLSRIPSIMHSRNSIGGVLCNGQGSDGNMRSTQQNLDRIRELEFHFHMSLLPENAGWSWSKYWKRFGLSCCWKQGSDSSKCNEFCAS